MLNDKEIKKLILKKDLIQNYINLEKQLTPNGFDLTTEAIFEFDDMGAIDFSNKERKIPQGKIIFPKKKNTEDKYGWWYLKGGSYKVRTNEIVNLPNNLFALCFSRSSLLRMGAFTQHAVWDIGFSGKGEFILVIENPYGIMLKENCRLAQLVFFKVKKPQRVYEGIFNKVRLWR